MKIEFDINEKYQENKIIICTNKITEDVKKLIEKIRDEENIKLYGYKDEVIQYGNISNLILRIIYSSIFYFIILIAVNIDKGSDDMIKKLSFKKYLFFKMIIIGIVIINSILSVFILDRFIKDEIFAISFYMDLFIIILLFTISTIIYKKSLEKKINDKLKRI